VLLVSVGRRTNALILVANGKHVLTDVWTSVGVLIGVGLVWLTNIRWLDPVAAMVVATNILWSAVQLIRNALQGLLDEVDPATTRTLRDTLDHCVDGGMLEGYHQLRHRVSNDVLWVEAHFLLPGRLSLREAHALVNQVEAAVHRAFPKLTVQLTSHLEPQKHETAHPKGHPGVADPYGG
jgi:cation diffusion facilitator family transporter